MYFLFNSNHRNLFSEFTCYKPAFNSFSLEKMATSRHCFILSLVAVLSLSVIDVSLGARHLLQTSVPVSYTHLTLPTIYSV